MTNLLEAIVTTINNCQSSELLIDRSTKNSNRINAVGDALEEFIKDAFADTFNENDSQSKLNRYARTFSWSGNANNPPDLILRYGDAIEVKKIQSLNSQIALNSSYPKSKLFANSPLIAFACRQCEEWTEKDLIYAIGVVNKEKLRLL
jgi:NgoPII restriction endonuclease